MFAKIIDSNKFTIIDAEDDSYIFSGQKLWKADKYAGSCKKLPKMRAQDRLVLKYDSTIKKIVSKRCIQRSQVILKLRSFP